MSAGQRTFILAGVGVTSIIVVLTMGKVVGKAIDALAK